ncbi:HAD-IA family hydrolase [Fonticella tunisiensis]|uniref:HAD superfamily hydrolase (TIGR01509 family)/HAD superfamily hydrolase (TIGR01549 family) n=1 Tax=Fonticella tunisiensis TaxID=1096341 RepID=A0A4R7KAH3_9CLOT|nr:HAD-IA family hydrolase [Fonticella tunisiensis]TDT51375.1 HAD superfamily hydrolase (TIGR01509 family)/HAD superfamily hydrolase (TIGR01549 family) [Fonticella tunisiensis]
MFTDIIWDFDGTLFDTYPGMVDAFQRALKEDGIEEDGEDILSLMKSSLSCAVNHYKDKYSLRDDFIERYSAYEKNIEETKRAPFPYAREICEAVIKKEGRNFLLTHRGNSTHKYLKYYEMESLFAEIVTKHYGFNRKPHPQGFLYLINKYKIDKSRALGVGDRELDVLAAKNAGIKACLYMTYEIPPVKEADYTITSLKEMYDILDL